MSRKKRGGKQIFWPGGFWANDVCALENSEKTGWEIVIVVPANPADIPEGYVPVVYACKKGQGRKSPKYVPASSLSIYQPMLKTYPPSEEKCFRWAMDFFAGDPIKFKGQEARVAAIKPHKVPLGCVPFYCENKPKEIYYAPADDIYRR